MDSKELKGLVEAYSEVYAPQEEIEEAVKGADTEMRKAGAVERKAGDKRLSPSKGRQNAEKMERDIKFYDKITKKTKPSVVGMTHEEVENVEEASYSAKAARAGKDIGKPGKAFAKIAASAGKRYGSKERGEKVAGAVLAKLRKEELDVFDVVLEYLVAEGYADNNREALHIMANSSEEQILEYRKLAAAAVGGMMALNMMKPGMPAPKVKTPTPEREKTELVSKAKTGKEDKESKQYIQNRLERDRELGISK